MDSGAADAVKEGTLRLGIERAPFPSHANTILPPRLFPPRPLLLPLLSLSWLGRCFGGVACLHPVATLDVVALLVGRDKASPSLSSPSRFPPMGVRYNRSCTALTPGLELDTFGDCVAERKVPVQGRTFDRVELVVFVFSGVSLLFPMLVRYNRS